MECFPETFIDIHTHILPGVDDGPPDIKASVLLADYFVRSGVNKIVATPHYIPGTAWSADKRQVVDAVKALREELSRESVNIEVLAGMEIACHKRMIENIESGKLLSLGNSEHYLIEPSFGGRQDSLLKQLQALLKNGVKVILAHPERITFFQELPESLAKLIDAGLKIQVTASSLLGYFGLPSKTTADRFVKDGWVDFIASDAHDTTRRVPISPQDWYELGLGPVGEKMIRAVYKNMLELFENK